MENSFEERLIKAGPALRRFTEVGKGIGKIAIGATNSALFGKLMENPGTFVGKPWGNKMRESKLNLAVALHVSKEAGKNYREGRSHLYNSTENKVTNYLFNPSLRPKKTTAGPTSLKLRRASRHGCFGIFSLSLGLLNSWLGAYFFENPEKFVTLPTADFLKTSGLRYAVSNYQTGEATSLVGSAVDHFYDATSDILDVCRKCCGKKREKEKKG